MLRTSRLALAMALVVAGCGDDRRPGTTPDAGSRDGGEGLVDEGLVDEGLVERDGGREDDAGSAVADAGGPVDGYPDVPRTHVGHSDWNFITVVSHNLVQDAATDFEQLYVVIRNDHPTNTFCSMIFRFEFFDAAGASITFRTGGIDGIPRRIYSIDSDCLPPGGTGLGYGNSSWSLPIDDVARIDFTFSGSGAFPSDVSEPANAVINEGLAIVDPYGSGTLAAVRGTMRVVRGSIRNPDITVFPIDARGLAYDELIDIDLITVSTGSTWPFTSNAASPFTEYLFAYSYSSGSAPLLRDTPEVRAAIAQRDQHALIRDEMRGRRRVTR